MGRLFRQTIVSIVILAVGTAATVHGQEPRAPATVHGQDARTPAAVLGQELRAPASRVEDVTVTERGDSTLVEIKTSGPRRFRTDLIDAPLRLVVDFDEAALAWRRTPVVSPGGPLVRIRGGQYRQTVARVVLDLKSPVPYSIREEGSSIIVVLGASAESEAAVLAPISLASAAPGLPSAAGTSTHAPAPIVPIDPATAPGLAVALATAAASGEMPVAPDAATTPAAVATEGEGTPAAAAAPADPPATTPASASTEAPTAAAPPTVPVLAPDTVSPALTDAGQTVPVVAPAPMKAADATAEARPTPPAAAPRSAPAVAALQAAPPALTTPPPAPTEAPTASSPAAAGTPGPAAAGASTAPTSAAAAESRLISMEFKDADVVNLLRILAAESGRNMVMGDDVKGKMSISLRNVPWNLALQTILETKGLERVDRDGVIRIVSTEQIAKNRELIAKEREARVKEEEAKAKAEEARLRAELEARTKRAEAEIKEREAQLKEQEIQARKRAADAALAEAIARGPLTEMAIRLAYADPGEVANTLQGLLALNQGPAGAAATIRPCREEATGFTSKEGATVRTVRVGTGGGVSGPIAEPPFSQLFGPPRVVEEVPVAVPPVPEDVMARTRTVRAHCSTNTLILRLHASDLQRVLRLIRESLDIPAPQVKIEARMEILDREDLFAIGVQWGGGGVLAVDNRNVIVGRGFTSDPVTNPAGLGIPAAGLGALSNPNLEIGTPGSGTVIPVSGQSGLPLGGNLINLPIGALLNNAAATGGAGGIMFGIIGSKLNLNLTLEALRTQGKTFTLARPDVVTVENKQARIALGEEIPFATVSSAGTQIQFKEALLQLVVTPTVVRDPQRNRVKMTVLVENNSRGNVVNLGTSGAPPAINKRSAETEVLINDGDHLVIGGITTSLQQEQVRKVPLFGDIPVLGWLFKQRGTQDTRRELVVFITPSLFRTDVRPGPPPPPPPPQPPAK